jgi:tRNA dimethylallyltransferase
MVAVVGPTATGKSDLGVALAIGLDAEVVNADAMQLYRGMDVGTAKLSPAERRGVPHHQLDVLAVSEEASVAGYQRHARDDVAAVHRRGRRVVVVGGSGLYVRALIDHLDIPPTDPGVRSDLEALAAAEGPGALHDALASVDPQAADRIGRGNTRRLVRALEVVRITGRPFSATLPDHVPLMPTVFIGLDCAREVLDRRIAARVDRMWQRGLVDEVRGLVPLGMGRTASRARGYAEVLALLDGRMSAEEARASTVTGTRRLARRQMGWFGRDPRVHWLDAEDPGLVDHARELVAAADAGTLPAPSAGRRTLGS